jgi:hypothetical protein
LAADGWFAAQSKEFCLAGLKKLEQWSHSFVINLKSKHIFSIPYLAAFFIKPNTYQPPSPLHNEQEVELSDKLWT